MRIALVAPPFLPIPPRAYGGTEKIVASIADGLVSHGHDVTLFASGDSKTKAKLVSILPKSLGIKAIVKDSALVPLLEYNECVKREKEFDIIHSHAEYLGLFALNKAKTPVVHTWHGSYYEGETTEEKRKVLKEFKTSNFITISDNQRGGIPELNYIATVYNGIDVSKYSFSDSKEGKYLLWVGRMAKEKGPLDAIRTAKKLNIPLILIGAIDVFEQDYFNKVIKPEINTKLITFISEETAPEKLNEFYKNAICTLFPISWHEPFGLVIIESMASGTPVVAYDMGSISEILRNGLNGYYVDRYSGIQGLADAVKKIGGIDRRSCRQYIEENFSVSRMVDNYEKVYAKLLQ